MLRNLKDVSKKNAKGTTLDEKYNKNSILTDIFIGLLIPLL